jgi:hypothetical protein
VALQPPVPGSRTRSLGGLECTPESRLCGRHVDMQADRHQLIRFLVREALAGKGGGGGGSGVGSDVDRPPDQVDEVWVDSAPARTSP